MPFQNNKGINGAKVVRVPEKTGKNTSPAAILAASTILLLPFSKMRCVFSITTIASSTTIPKANKNENNTIMFKVNPMVGIIKNATNIDSGTDIATNMALVAPMKNIKIKVTKINPITMVLIKSCRVVRVLSDWSPVITTFKSFGKVDFSISFTMALILSDDSIKFSPERLITERVMTFFPAKRAKLFCSSKPSLISAISLKYIGAPACDFITNPFNSSTDLKERLIEMVLRKPSMRTSPPEIVKFS